MVQSRFSDDSDLVILARLAEYGIDPKCGIAQDPWGVGFRPDMVKAGEGSQSEPYSEGSIHGMIDEEKMKDWDAERHAARVHYIMQSPDLLKEPIEIDCECLGSRVLNIPVVLDGWHRLHAHWLLGRKTIRVAFSGRLDLLDYLTGVTDEPPED